MSDIRWQEGNNYCNNTPACREKHARIPYEITASGLWDVRPKKTACENCGQEFKLEIEDKGKVVSIHAIPV